MRLTGTRKTEELVFLRAWGAFKLFNRNLSNLPHCNTCLMGTTAV
jgi:hypothetical protein